MASLSPGVFEGFALAILDVRHLDLLSPGVIALFARRCRNHAAVHFRGSLWQGNCYSIPAEVLEMACEHKVCRCQEAVVERSGKKFCSERCAEMESGREKTARCSCGHPACAA